MAGGGAAGVENGDGNGLFSTSHKVCKGLAAAAGGDSAAAGVPESVGTGAGAFFLKKLNFVWGSRAQALVEQGGSL